MNKSRMEAFSDGVFAILITIMVLELRAPRGAEFSDLAAVVPVFLGYAMSFVYLAIYWNNHHHMLQAVKSVDGASLWANHLLLFWLSLFPFATAWMDENHFSPVPVAVYGVPLLLASLCYSLLCSRLIRHNGRDSTLARVLARDWKARISTFAYVAAIPLAFVRPAISLCLYVSVAVLWVVPESRLERALNGRPSGERK